MTTLGVLPAEVAGGNRAPLPVAGSTIELDVQPPIAVGRRGVGYGALVTNRGSVAVEARTSVTAGAALLSRVAPAQVVIEPGQAARIEIAVASRRPRLVGCERQHALTLHVRNAGGATLAARDLVFVQQRPRIAWLLAAAALLVAAAAVVVSRPPDRVTVPDVRGAQDAATAERTLKSAKLLVDPRLQSRTVPGMRPGAILDQIPAAGARAVRGDRVTLLIAIGARRSVTPALNGQTPARAAALLRAAGLTPGPVLPPRSPAAVIVDGQLPVAGARVPVGTAVTLFVRTASGPAKRAAAPATARAKVPAVDGRSVTAYARAVAAAGLVPKVIRAVSPTPLGTIVGVRPRPGLELAGGERVRLVVSAGVPELAFDTGDVVRTFALRHGRSTREASPPQGKAVEPSWSSDGRRLLYRVGRRLTLVSARLADRGRVVYEGRTRYAAATLAPAPADGVVALVRRGGGNGDLCFGRIGPAQLRPRCQADKRWDLGRQISWRRDGRELLVFGVRRGHPETFGMLRYRSARPYSTKPSDWRGVLATDASVGGRGVIAASYSPDGRRVALVTSVGLPRFQLLLTAAGNLRDPAARALPVRACEVTWRPDGLELAVVQSDAACGRPLGQIVRLNPASPRRTTSVTSGGRHPAYQPLTYTGPKGVS